MAKPSCKLRNEAQIPPESTCDVLRNSSRALLSYAIHEIFFFLTSGKMSCVSMDHTVLSHNSLYAENNSACNDLVYVTQKLL